MTVLRALVLLVLAALPGAATSLPGRTHQIRIRGFAYVPPHLEVAAGDTLVWSNEDFTTHTVTPDTAAWDSGDLPANRQFRRIFTKRGTVGYHCELHPSMKGVIVIR